MAPVFDPNKTMRGRSGERPKQIEDELPPPLQALGEVLARLYDFSVEHRNVHMAIKTAAFQSKERYEGYLR